MFYSNKLCIESFVIMGESTIKKIKGLVLCCVGTHKVATWRESGYVIHWKYYQLCTC